MGTQSNSSFDQSEDTFSSEMDSARAPNHKKERKVFLIAQEIMTSERAYVGVLSLIYKSFRYSFYFDSLLKHKTIIKMALYLCNDNILIVSNFFDFVKYKLYLRMNALHKHYIDY